MPSSPFVVRRAWLRQNLGLILGVGLFLATIAVALNLLPSSLASSAGNVPTGAAPHSTPKLTEHVRRSA